MTNYRVPWIVTPDGKLVNPASCGVVWLTDGEVNSWNSTCRDPNVTLGDQKVIFDGRPLRLANQPRNPNIAERYRDESATEPTHPYRVVLEEVCAQQLATLNMLLEAALTTPGTFADGPQGVHGQAVGALLDELARWTERTALEVRGDI